MGGAHHGLGVPMAIIFLAGEMAGSGILALPNAMIGTGWWGVAMIFLFMVNACFCGTRLGICWTILEERYEEFRHPMRNPYPAIGEKALGKFGKVCTTLCVCITLYGTSCVFIALISQMLGSFLSATVGFDLSICKWMVIVAAVMLPLTWFGTPKDFWFVAVGALLTTSTAVSLIVAQAAMDHKSHSKPPSYPPPTTEGFFKAFSSIMFAFAGASTFPTIQSDMKDRKKFPIAVVSACIILFSLYMPVATSGYLAFGSDTQSNIVESLSDGPLKKTAEIMLVLHLVAAFPIVLNPPSQYFENLLKIPPTFNWKRCLFRAFTVISALFVAESIPSFGNILDLVGASTITLLNFVFPPLFYMRLCDETKKNPVDGTTVRNLGKFERAFYWFLILLGIAGGVSSTYTAIKNIFVANFAYPCYISRSGNMTS